MCSRDVSLEATPCGYNSELTCDSSGGSSFRHCALPYNCRFHRGKILAYEDLRDWIAALERAGELKTIRTEVDPVLEITEIIDRVSKNVGAGVPPVQPGGSALLFKNIKGHPGAQVLMNQFGSARRMNLALEVDALDQVADRIRAFMDVKSPQGFLDKVKMLPMLAEMGKFFPKTVATGPCKEVIKRDNFSLLDFPILQCWPKDAGRFITLPCVVSRDPKTGKRNVGMHRPQLGRIQPVHSVLSAPDHRHHSNLAQHPQVLGNSGLRHPHSQDHFSHGILPAIGQHPNHLAPPGLGDRVEYIRRGCRSRHWLDIFLYENMSRGFSARGGAKRRNAVFSNAVHSF